MQKHKTCLHGIAKKVQVTKAIQDLSFSKIYARNVS